MCEYQEFNVFFREEYIGTVRAVSVENAIEKSNLIWNHQWTKIYPAEPELDKKIQFVGKLQEKERNLKLTLLFAIPYLAFTLWFNWMFGLDSYILYLLESAILVYILDLKEFFIFSSKPIILEEL